MKTKILIALLFFTQLFCYSQGEANFWHFGVGAGLDFTSGTPIAITAALSTKEGSASISSPSGKLLFYTDGITVFNKDNKIMMNGTGLLGDSSTTQSATIVLLPGSTTLYYVFALDEQAGINGFTYSIVDMTLEGGLGAVISKNNLIYTRTCEKISIVKHANGEDYWIVTHQWDNNTFDARILSATGLNLIPVLSNVGTVITGPKLVSGEPNGNEAIGYMKISPDGSKLALCHSLLGKVELYDFDNVTGIVSNDKLLIGDPSKKPISKGIESFYGVEYSPNGSILYVSSNSPDFFMQFDLSAPNIPASMRIIPLSGPKPGTRLFRPSALQLGPDGKIYVSAVAPGLADPAPPTSIGVIKNPNIMGAGCNFIEYAVPLNGGASQSGLPSFDVSIFFKPSIFARNTCNGSLTELELVLNQKTKAVTWDFGDGTPPVTVLNNNKIAHTYANSSNYTVKATAIQGAYKTFADLQIDLKIEQTPTATTPADKKNILICDNNNNGLFRFDLTKNTPEILNGQDPAQFSVRYFENAIEYANNKSIVDPTKYNNAKAYASQTIYAEVTNTANPLCKAVTTFEIDVFDSPTAAPLSITPISKCDDSSVGTTSDGFALFDLTQRIATILSTQIPKPPTVYLVNFYEDAALSQLITNATAYPNKTKSQTIYVKIFNLENANCFVQTSFVIEVLDAPVANNATLELCDLDTDGFTFFDLSTAIPKITATPALYTYNFFESLGDAIANTKSIASISNYKNKTAFSDNQVFVRVNTAVCSLIVQVTLTANIAPLAPTATTPVFYCTTQTPTPLTAVGTNLLWYTTASGGLGSSIAPTPDTKKLGETLYYVSQSKGSCEGPRAAVRVVVNAIPTATLPDTANLCVDAVGKLLVPYTIDTGLSATDFSFQWYEIKSGVSTAIAGANQNKYITSSVGTFGVIVTDKLTTCESTLINTTVSTATKPLSMEISTPEYFTDPIDLSVSINPTGDFQYKIDGGSFQESNLFYNVSSGTSVKVTVKSDCGEISKELVLINYPKFFTPNGDGVNDTWNIFDLKGQKETSIQIFDRFGKLIAQLKPNAAGWDGTYNGAQLPATDYWFVVFYSDKNKTPKEFRAHFSLKR